MSEPTGKLGEIFDRLNAGAGGSHLHQILNSLIWYLAERETIPVPALERGGETNINLNPNAKYFCPNCGLSQFETSRERHNKECPGRSAPTPATVEKYRVYGFNSLMGGWDKTKPHGMQVWSRKPIGEVVATRHGSTPTQCIEIVHNGKSEIFSPKQYEWIVEHLTSAGVWERKDA